MCATKLSVNLNKVALLRNTRALGIPSVLRAAEHCIKAGAHGITVHPRPDERHIRKHDVLELAEFLQQYPQVEYNIEGNPLHNLMDFIRKIRPHQCTFVPDNREQSTSDHGWDFPDQLASILPFIEEAVALGIRVSLFMDIDNLEAIKCIPKTGAHRIELYTEPWARAFGTQHQITILQKFITAKQLAQDLGLGVNAGHDLNCDNLRPFLQGVQGIKEVSIGHALIADAMEMGYTRTVETYLDLCT
jgi:pyridoxine 5-phosphate synthase